ncbi:MAG: hypothetical protein EZS28_033211, partial [Streblomastix strix]
AKDELTSFIAHELTQWRPDRSKTNESQGSDTQKSTQTEVLARKGIEYANNLIAMMRERVKLQFDAEIQVMLAESPFASSTSNTHDEDYETKMKYLCKRILDNDMKAAKREDPEDFFIKNEKRRHDTEDIKPVQSQKSIRGEDWKHLQKMVIDLEQADRDEGWDEPFQGFPKRLCELHRQQGTRSGRMNNSQQGQMTHDRTRQSPGKQMAEILSKKMAVQASVFKPLGYSDRLFIFRDMGKFRYMGSDWKIVTSKGRTRLEQGDQFADARIGLLEAQQALLVAMENELGGHNNIELIAYAYAMLCVCKLGSAADRTCNCTKGAKRSCGRPQKGRLVAFSISTGAVRVPIVLNPVFIVAIAFVPTILAIPTVLAIRDTVNTVCCELVQLRKRSSSRKRISGKRTRRKRQESLQFHIIPLEGQ